MAGARCSRSTIGTPADPERGPSLRSRHGGGRSHVSYSLRVGLRDERGRLGTGRLTEVRAGKQPSRALLHEGRRSTGRVSPVQVDDVTALELSHDGGLLAAGSYNGMLRLWSVETGQLLAERRAHNAQYVDVVRFSARWHTDRQRQRRPHGPSLALRSVGRTDRPPRSHSLRQRGSLFAEREPSRVGRPRRLDSACGISTSPSPNPRCCGATAHT